MHRKIKYLTILIMVISGTVSAGGVANTPENRQFLKQQEELSRQLRDRPDAELKAWADWQIQANPLIQSDGHFLDDLARKQQASQADKPEQGAAYFISFSIPEEGLKRMLRETRRYGIPATLRGMRDNDLKATADAVLSLVKDGVTDGVQIDPTLFTKYDIRSVPALVVYCRQGYDVIRGNLRVKQALEKVATAGDCRQTAGEILQKNKR
ncbi:type-F conjugative transfer system pilin assembly protein TrbC [Salmonella enterica subsp. diarizonae]|nr:type-F conjugative transfer system pilin assembly protein TrbC [Salmonella enterica subsp. diarizonae]